MSVFSVFDQLQNSDISTAISRQDHLFGAGAQLLHISGLILVLSSILIVSLRLLGLGLVQVPLPRLVKATAKFIWLGLALLAISGVVIFLPAADHYYPNPVFWLKFGLLAFAIVLHLTWYRRVTRQESVKPLIARGTAALLLTTWFGIAYAARFIGFY
ncbi:DUF6644 family protein [Undibacterium sp. MH2W]|uniref:DUF6644 family protein n=1 Tax=Undibacterium sp. MH2W TaxID=3413044 RepID=UPI003BEFC1E2